MNQQTVRVLTVRSQNPRGFGGAIFTGRAIDTTGNAVDGQSYLVVRASAAVLGGATVESGQWWRLAGKVDSRVLDQNGYRITEQQIQAETATMMRPSGEHVVAFMAEGAAFEGIGTVKARKLWEKFGDQLYDILEQGDVAALMTILTPESARTAITAWAGHGDARTLQWLQSQGFSVALGRKVLAFFGADTPTKLEADPYRLLSFCANWRQVDALALNHFKIDADDPRRLQGAAEEALYRVFGDGHTCTPIHALISRLASVLDGPCREKAGEALAHGLSNGSFVLGTDGIVHPIGAWIMEANVSRTLAERLLPSNNVPLLHRQHVDSIVAEYEASEGIALNDEQRLAIHMASANALALIVGGAGVGKTTVLKALYKIFDEAGTRVFQVALAGRAAKRMLEATGRPASTIASFIRNVTEENLAGRCVLVVDEASMVDIMTMSRLCEMLPTHVRLVLAGDPSQLMPVGPGLVLHAIAGVAGIPQVELKVGKRFGGSIALAAQAVRDGRWPELADDASAPISFIPCPQASMTELIVALYEKDAPNTQILSPRRNSADGTKAINALCQRRFAKSGRALLVYLEELEAFAGTGFYLGDQLLCTRNMWDWGLQNGSLGRLVEIEDTPRILTNADGAEIGHAIGWVLWDDGERRPILESMLDDLELGYAVTVHKAQGSQWPRVIVAITGSRMLDRTLIYTAMTRAQTQVIIVGDPGAARQAVQGLPRAHSRMVGLGSLLQEYLAQTGSPPEVALPDMLA
ncbi:ATP-dependent DNA helicase [Janthinobacterium sp. DSP2-3-3]|uniref:ATP-dependent DNA helicase n=1 Tax=Janthinobacterium sp. DSP2-3-3 TaxID=2804596 RepID=UPI003CF43313